ncbi:MAG: hypothetical protein PHX62_02910 [Bacilli bacterium]|nr:hypothetical protein [Bacilli bacterium]
MNEKKVSYIIVAVALLAIVAVILISIPWGGDKAAINAEYDSIEDNDHIFVSLKYDELIEKIENNQTFQVYIGSSELPQAESFVFMTNKLGKERGIDTIYYLNSSKLTEIELLDIKGRSSTSITLPTLIYWMAGDFESNTPYISSLKNFKDYNSNWSILLTEYFDECLLGE